MLSYFSLCRHPELDSSHYPSQPGKHPGPGPPTLSKSRTIDTLKTEQKVPGTSPSSTSLRQSKSRTDFKEDQKSSMMPSFLSDVSPFGAVTSVVNKFNPFELISDSDTAQDEAAKKQKLFQKEQGKTEQQKGPTKPPVQQPSPKAAQKGAVKTALEKVESSKQVQPQQQQQQQPPAAAGVAKQKKQEPGGPPVTDTPSEEAKRRQVPPKTQHQHSESTKPVPQQSSAAKPFPQQPGAAKQPDAAKPTTPMAAAPTKPSAQQGVISLGKHPPQQPGGPAKTTPQTAGTSKQLSQQPGEPAKPSPLTAGSTKQPLGPVKISAEHAGSVKQPQQLAGHTKSGAQQPAPEKPVQQQHAGSPRPGSQAAELAPKKTFCPLCTTSELLLQSPEKANYNKCTQCQTVVCSLCGFDPNPHITEVSNSLLKINNGTCY